MTELIAPFVDRTMPLRKLTEFAQQVSLSNGAIVALAGMAGCGKSVLLQRFIEYVNSTSDDHYEVMAGRCIDSDAMPYLPFVDAMRRYFNVTGIDPASTTMKIKEMLFDISKDLLNLLPVVGPLLSVGVTVAQHSQRFSTVPEFDQNYQFYAVAQVLLQLSKKKKIILVIEDIHWADRSTLHLLQYLAEELRKSPVLIIVTYRPQPIGKEMYYITVMSRLLEKGQAHELRVSDFDRTEFEDYLRQVFQGAGVSTGISRVLFSQTHGNPFFLSQIIPILLKEELITLKGRMWERRNLMEEIDIPSSVEAAVQCVLDRLEPHTQSTLEIAAVIGEQFEYPVLARASRVPEPDLDNEIDTLMGSQIINELPNLVDEYGFIHAITREVVYRRMANRRRRHIHLSVAQVIEEMFRDNQWEVLETLAHHFYRGGDMTKAIEYYLRAASKARALFAYDEALRYDRMAIAELSDDDPRLLPSLLEAGTIAEYVCEWSLARASFTRALDISQKRNLLDYVIQAYLGLAMIEFRESKWAASEEYCESAMQIIRSSGQESALARALALRGRICWRTGRWPEAKTSLEEAMRIQEELDLWEDQVATSGVLGVIYRNYGLNDEAIRLYQHALTIGDNHQEVSPYWLGGVQNNLGTVYRSIAAQEDSANPGLDSPFWNRAIEYYEKSLEAGGKIRSWRDLGNTCNNLAMVYRSRTDRDLNRAMEYCRLAEDYLARVDSPIDVLETKRHMGAILGLQGKWAEGITVLSEGVQIADRIGAADRGALLYREMGLLFLDQGHAAEAQRHLLTAQRRFAELGAGWRVEEIGSLLKRIELQQS